MHFVYFLKSQKNGKVYTGMTTKIPAQRLKEHHLGSNKWTRENGPFDLIYYESYHCKQDAQSRELFYKSGFGRKVRNSIIETINMRA